jgi:hypothetical protein
MTAPSPFAAKLLALARLVARKMEPRIVTPMYAELLIFRSVNQAARLNPVACLVCQRLSSNSAK